MISFLYRIVSQFERENGHRPNLIFLHPAHMEALQCDLASIHGLGELVRFLGMEIIVDAEIVHPQVMWSGTEGISAIAG